jgi:CRP-like cAMP-binding protein
MQQGDHGESMFIVLQGLLEIWRTQQNGDSSLIAKIEPGHCFGEMSLLTGEVRSATVRATTEVFTLEITRPVLEQLLSGRPELGVRISEIVAERQLSLEQARLGHEEALAARTQRGLAAQLYDRMRQFIGLS